MAFPKLVQSDSIDDGPMMTQERFKELLGGLENNVSEVVVVSQERLRFSLLALVCQGHVLLEDSPGVGKTLIAKTLAQSIDGEFARVQCTPDLLPSDITGTSIFNVQDSRFEFKPGPVFANILLATRSTEPVLEHNPRSLKRWPKTRSAPTAACTGCRLRSWSWRHRTPWRAMACFRCLTLSEIDS